MRMRICLLEEIPPEEMNDFEVDGRTILLANVDGDILAMDGLCSHRKGVLAKGSREEYVVKCPRHGTEYDLRDGKVVRNVRIPLIGKAVDLRTYPITVEGDERRFIFQFETDGSLTAKRSIRFALDHVLATLKDVKDEVEKMK